MIKNIKWLAFIALAFVACNSDDEAIVDPNSTDGTPLTAGSADFSKYVALGDSFAAGFSDNALFMEGQKNSYPNIIASQFALVGGGEFTTPFMNDNIGGFSSGGVQIPQFGPRLWFNAATSTPTPVTGVSTTDISTHLSGPFNNFGIPGAKATHLDFAGYATANPYFGRMASSTTATVVDDAVATNPTFFSLWIGGNDVLGYATSGGVSTSPITPTTTFNAVYNALIAKLTSGGRKGVIANLPYVSTLPYFTTVPYNPVPLDAATAAQLNAGYAAYNNGLLFAQSNGLLTAAEVAQRTISFSASATNKVVIVDEYLTNLTGFGIPSYRQATSEDLIVLPARAFIGTTVGGNPLQVNGVSVPLADQWVLSKNEIAEVKAATDSYNQTIQDAATANGLALVDAKTLMTQLSTTGVVANNYTLTSTYVTGATFSLDGVHPSPRGYAFIANQFLKAINETYGSNFKGVNVGTYRILYPQDPANF
ncbi:SGNH/GDSL hydrolase family protein [Flavobacterium capsici]|uniref:SGNH/GDSL hydrolase family protein n=1 Tax=Flavobacterium capsici TaxID=3075618 RepID=A0AA96J2S9_9FLAO|nr:MULTISPECIES: SGNH/GDSL hydrolase family protein [unclassified Flavobacterium]WNM19797.1 SGNH/GDSL hydrolase family protein [Flavobacterium sp. PMR2A8]WNM21186.1 SGNH/GDSL hydrolase family protein [Flavobacterium sp. PMTSA4]